MFYMVFPGGSEGKESACNTGDLGSAPRVGKIPWRRTWQPTPGFLPAESPWTEEPGGLRSKELQRVGREDMTERLSTAHNHIEGSSGSSAVKNLPAMRQMQVQLLSQEDSLEKDIATHSSVLPTKSYRQRSLVDYTVHWVTKDWT